MNKGENVIGKGQIIIYQSTDGSANLDVKLENDTVWLTQSQMVRLFQKTKQNISLHINNIFKEGELDRNSVVKESLTTASDGKSYYIQHYSLDVIISVGYRVKSQQGTQFRIWANKILKEYLIKGYAINEKIKSQQYNELKQTVKLLSNVIQNKELSANEATGLLQVITDYTYALDTLDRYDYQELAVELTTQQESFRATYNNAKEAFRTWSKSGYKNSHNAN